MKGEISSDGYLRIYRNSKGLQHQGCPYVPPNSGYGECYCGDWCPLFGEPQYGWDDVTLTLCNKTLALTDFTDRRTQ